MLDLESEANKTAKGTVDTGELIEEIVDEINRRRDSNIQKENYGVLKMDEKIDKNKDIKDIKETLANYEGEKLLDDFVAHRQEYWQDEIEDDPLAYLSNYLDMNLGDAIQDGYITVDEDALIEGAIDSDGIAHFVAPYDGDEQYEKVNGVEYYIYRTD